MFIYPQVARLRRVYIRPRQTNVYSGSIPARLGGEGVEFFGVREYKSGDPPHWINWRASAHDPERLYANDFEQERVADVGIILDARTRTNLVQRRSLLDYSVTAVSALSEAFLNDGNRVGLLIYGGYLKWTYPGYGRLQRERILHALTRARLGDSLLFNDLSYIPTRIFPPNSQLALVSPLHSEDLDILVRLSLRGYQALVISPDPAAFEYSLLPPSPALGQARRILTMERDLLISRLHPGCRSSTGTWNVHSNRSSMAPQPPAHRVEGDPARQPMILALSFTCILVSMACLAGACFLGG